MRRHLLLLGLAFLPGAADACTTIGFTQGERPVMAYNFDFHIGQGVVLVNKRGLDKMSETQGRPARWRARYASVTFTMFGRDNPMTGMNEAGLAASQMWLDEARYEDADERATIGVVEWLQYVLDTSATIEEALANIAKIRIESRITLHYKLMDANGHAAVVEYLDGEPVIRTGNSLPHAVLANDTYARSLDFAAKVAAGEAQANGSGSLARFMRAALARTAPRDPAADPIAQGFSTLEDVAQDGQTQWSVVYDVARRRVHWRTRQNASVRFIDLARFDGSCAMPTMVVGIDEGQGDVSGRFRRYRTEDNEKLLLETVRATPFLAGTDDASLRQWARSPEQSRCRTK